MSRQKINISKLTDTDIYKLVLNRKLYRFPRNFWEKPDALNSAKEITICLIEEILQWTDEDVKEKLSRALFYNYKLGGMINVLFDSSPYRTINNAYPNKFKPWELKRTPAKFWNKETSYEFIRWFIEEKNNWTDEEIKNNFSKTLLINMGFDAPMDRIKEDTFEIINKLYPNKFKPWELKQVAINYWDKKTISDAIKWLIEEKLHLDIERDKVNFSNELLENNGLKRLTSFMSRKKISLYEMFNYAYPNKFKEWEIIRIHLWTKQKKIEAVKWLVEEKLCLDPKTELNKVLTKHFWEYGLSGLLTSCGQSYKKALELAYADYYSPYK
ncbi:hypothetical protein G8S55_08890 [Clostridium botulinum C]|uniref:hypothetical protein n=1 Tax=Clostridium botulinum TaxID=1491 RepID=UPI001E3E126E|nr:hypothetical protein [Clostridium botulinum]MCD3217363.1 hypothetical protein [Clostridium botulinum C]